MVCPNCNEKEHEPNAIFCHVCGHRLDSMREDLEIYPFTPVPKKHGVNNPFKRISDAVENSDILFGLLMILAWILPFIIGLMISRCS